MEIEADTPTDYLYNGADAPTDYLYNSTLRRDWDAVVKIYEEHPALHAAKVTKSEDTALHVAALHAAPDIVERMVGAIARTSNEECMKNILSTVNNSGNHPPHCAASTGSRAACEHMALVDRSFSLVNIRNNRRETPLFLAALHGHKDAFFFLHSISVMNRGSTATPWRGKGVDTILHCTLEREFFDLAFQIFHLHKDRHIATTVNERGITPLHVLANKPSAFESGTRFGWRSKLQYRGTIVDKLQVDVPESLEIDMLDNGSKTPELPENYHTCYNLFAFFLKVAPKLMRGGALLKTGKSASGQSTKFPRNYATCFEFFKTAYICVYRTLGFGLLKTTKEKHVWCSQIMDELVEQLSMYRYFADGTVPHPDKIHDMQVKLEMMQSALLPAAKNGLEDMVEKILLSIPEAIHDITSDKKNILQVAVENRQPHIVTELDKMILNRNNSHIERANLIQAVDDKGNNVLHLAAKVPTYDKPW